MSSLCQAWKAKLTTDQSRTGYICLIPAVWTQESVNRTQGEKLIRFCMPLTHFHSLLVKHSARNSLKIMCMRSLFQQERTTTSIRSSWWISVRKKNLKFKQIHFMSPWEPHCPGMAGTHSPRVQKSDFTFLSQYWLNIDHISIMGTLQQNSVRVRTKNFFFLHVFFLHLLCLALTSVDSKLQLSTCQEILDLLWNEWWNTASGRERLSSLLCAMYNYVLRLLTTH